MVTDDSNTTMRPYDLLLFEDLSLLFQSIKLFRTDNFFAELFNTR